MELSPVFFLFIGLVHSGAVTHGRQASFCYRTASDRNLLCCSVDQSERKKPGEINSGARDAFFFFSFFFVVVVVVDGVLKAANGQCQKQSANWKLLRATASTLRHVISRLRLNDCRL